MIPPDKLERKAKKALEKAEAEARYQARLVELPSFTTFGKISRLNRDIIITEKIDGTNAAIGIVPEHIPDLFTGKCDSSSCGIATGNFIVYAQSRTRIITPEQDNYGFADWVEQHKTRLAQVLGPGLHFGEWWGKGINRGYGLDHRRFSLFNVKRWNETEESRSAIASLADINVGVVPVLYEGPWFEPGKYVNSELWMPVLHKLRLFLKGSVAAPGYPNPEGIVILHEASGTLFKVTIENDEKPKSVANAQV